ncbi:MAG: ATP-grasp fold amidoligase family protein [Wenzhouxiangella sp.]
MYNRFIERRFRERVESATSDDALPFSMQVKYENALKRLPDPKGLIHPQKFFFSKANQRAFLESIDAPLVPLKFIGELDALPVLEDGEYVIKPVKGCSARGVLPFDVREGTFDVEGKLLDLTVFKSTVAKLLGDQVVMVEIRLSDKYFDSLMDYKVYLFLGSGADHVSCIQRGGGRTGATFSPDGRKMDIGKYRKHPLKVMPQPEAIEAVVGIALHLQKKIPLSLIRLDFYVSHSGIYLGEMTPIPGDSGDFNAAHDLEMGRKWAMARARLRSSDIVLKDAAFFEANFVKSF